ncbi:MAG TPA: response regulator [Elusimicrobia bacterium]|nr:MAG: hypothetical protein A2X37_02095 [Elusimicrobia bacterium GWA2_66_18]OGR68418.1 MAG: hypothetical protein A2X40_09860 [Elusimicrobia bacterium GWC2_65_9]HAZ09039.1 response regulator [Elusimicrobiota bacterium]
MKILVIDDSMTMRKIIGAALKDLGHEVIEAVNGKVGLEVAKSQVGLTAVLVDWNMPEMNGYEFIVAMRADEKLKTTPIAMLTSETDIDNREKAIKAGANVFITKPFTKDVIREKLALLVPT